MSPREKTLNFVVDHLIWIVVLLMLPLMALTVDQFFTYNNLINIGVHATVLGILAIAQATVLIAGVFDLSVESTMGLVGYVMAWLVLGEGTIGSGWGVSVYVVVPFGMVLGVIIGWANGTLVTRLRMNAFLVTLSMLIILRGLTFVIGDARTLSGLPSALTFVGSEKLVGQWPVSVAITFAAFIAAAVIARYRRSGRRLYATGGNPDAARASGINPDAVVRRAFMVSGGLAAFAGLILTGQLGSAPANMGEGIVFEVFAATVIGGVSLRGGRGSYIDVLGGVLLLSMVSNALNLTRIDPFWVNPVRGTIILLAVLLDSQREPIRVWLLSRVARDEHAFATAVPTPAPARGVDEPH